MSYGMRKIIYRLLMSILTLLIVIIIFIVFGKPQPEGEYITKEEMVVLTELLNTVWEEHIDEENKGLDDIQAQKETMAVLEEMVFGWEVEEYVTYGQFKQWKKEIDSKIKLPNDTEEKVRFKKYRKSSFVDKKDLFAYFDSLCDVIDPEDKITIEELLILGDSSNVVDREGNPMEEGYVLSQRGKWGKKLAYEYIPMQQKGFYITYQGALWGVYHVEPAAMLFNAWIVENTEEKLVYFYKNYRITTVKSETIESLQSGQVADLNFIRGDLKEVLVKTDKLSGKVLKISENEIEIEGVGTYPISENIQYYSLYDSLETVGRSEIRLGYDFTDFVMEEGEIQAALIVKDEKMDRVRILIKNSNFEGYYHKKIEAKANVDMELIYGEKRIHIEAGEIFSIDSDSEYFVNNRIYLRPKNETGRCVFYGIERNNDGQGYFGSFELEKREEGILLINEVLLEEYLYAVVPSEMPGYYPMEALKAQAISARTYAYSKMLRCGIGSYGAHMDDSATYQVYNNIKENENTTLAVKETVGKLLYAENGLAETYYYSTSCGFGTDAAIWNANNKESLPYLQSKEMTIEKENYAAEELQTEEGFEKFISKTDTSHFESEEGWYRWTYQHKNIEKIAEKLKNRLENYPNYVFTSLDGEYWGHEPLEENFVIKDIRVKSRGAGGTIEELLVITDQGNFLVKNEYHIRAVMTDGEAKVKLQNDNTYACGNLLPSAFFVIETQKEKEQVVGVEITGGGFGHGVGMSQNGAGNLADLGYNAKEILEFYYEGCEVRE